MSTLDILGNTSEQADSIRLMLADDVEVEIMAREKEMGGGQ